jgi:hypothetical protein
VVSALGAALLVLALFAANADAAGEPFPCADQPVTGNQQKVRVCSVPVGWTQISSNLTLAQGLNIWIGAGQGSSGSFVNLSSLPILGSSSSLQLQQVRLLAAPGRPLVLPPESRALGLLGKPCCIPSPEAWYLHL